MWADFAEDWSPDFGDIGHASLWSAIAADMGVSLAVVFNALRLLGSSDDPLAGLLSALHANCVPDSVPGLFIEMEGES